MGQGSNGGGIDFAQARRMQQMAAAAAAQQAQPQPQMLIASPFNDVQSIAMIAANLQGSPVERVKFAMELMVESFGRMGDFSKMLEAKRKEMAPKVPIEA